MVMPKRPATRIKGKESISQNKTEKGKILIEKGKFGTIFHT